MIQTKLNMQEEIALHKEFNQRNSVRIIRQLNRYINAEINYYLSIGGHSKLSARHLSVFENLDFEGTNIVNLAQRAGMTKQAMSKLVKEVVAEGYLKVKVDERDSRALIVCFTDKGVVFLKDMRETIQNVRRKFKSNIALQNTDAMVDGMLTLLNFLERNSSEKISAY